MKSYRSVWALFAGNIAGIMSYALLERLILNIGHVDSSTRFQSLVKVEDPLRALPWYAIVAICMAQGIGYLVCASITTFSSKVSWSWWTYISVVVNMLLFAAGPLVEGASLWLFAPGLLLAWPSAIWGYKLGLKLQSFDRL